MKHSESCGVFIIRHDARYMVLLYYLTFRMHFLFRALFISGIVLMPLILVAKNRNAVFTSPERQVRLIELYTSEGCSSCPPADRWLSGLLTESHLWSSVVPIAFHVSYWDYLGWRDPFASEEYAKRQRIYASYGGTNVYTPGFFVNGREWRGFFENRVLPSPPNLRPGIFKIKGHADR